MPSPITLYESAEGTLVFRMGLPDAGKLDFLRAFYYCANTRREQQGVLYVFDCLTTSKDLQILLSIQHPLAEVPIYSSRLPDTGGPVTFFYFAGMYADRPDLLLHLLYILHDILAEFPSPDASQLLFEMLFTCGADSLPFFPQRQNDPFTRMALALECRVDNYRAASRWTAAIIAPQLPQGFTLFPTSGDLHRGGYAPLRVVSGSQTWYFKPRGLAPEVFFNMALERFNSFLPKDSDLHLPVFSFRSAPGSPPCLVSAARHVVAMEMPETILYARRFGALLCLAKVFGCTDLHEENIMATPDGPIIIDAECCFLHNNVRSPSLSTLGVRMLIPGSGIKAGENSNFSVGKTTFSRLIHNDPDVHTAVMLGFQQAAHLCQQNAVPLWDLYKGVLETPSFLPRVVPVGTFNFMCHMMNFLSAPFSAIPYELNKSIVGVRQWLRRQGYPTDNLRLDLLNQGLIHAFGQGDVPLFQVWQGVQGAAPSPFSTGTITMDGTAVLTFQPDTIAHIQFEFVENINWLATLEGPFS